MKIDSVTVLYNPEAVVYDNFVRYSKFMNKAFVMDNSTQKNEDLLAKLKQLPNVVIVDMDGNKGIAQALKDGMLLAIEDKADYCLNMDQDSIFPTEQYDEILKYLEKYPEYGIIGLNFNAKDETQTGLVDFTIWLTSGNFIKIEDYVKVRGYNPDLFIDCVDYDLYEQFYSKGIKTAYINEISLVHTIGNQAPHRFLWKKVHANNHSLVRYYYQYRNITYLYKYVNKAFYKKTYKKEMINKRIKILLYEKDRIKKFKMIRKGIRDGKKKILGPYKEEK